MPSITTNHAITYTNLEENWWELIKLSPDVKSFDEQANFLNYFFKEMYGYQSGQFVFGYWGLKG